MAVNFPQNPSEGDTFTNGNSVFAFTNGKWISATSPAGLVSKSGDVMNGLLTLSGDPVSDNQAATKLYVDSMRMAGEVTMWSGSTVPSGWLECNGQSTGGFAALAAIVGSNVPDLRGEFVRGWDNGRGVDPGRLLLSAQLDQMQRITGTLRTRTDGGFSPTNGGAFTMTKGTNYPSSGGTSGARQIANFDSADSPNARTSSTTSGETRPRNIALMYIIKT